MEQPGIKEWEVLSKFSLRDKVAIVTGAGRGIGKGIAVILAGAGADVVAVARTQGEIQKTADEVRAQGRKALAVKADVTDSKQVQGMVEETLKQFGKIDILINNAGGSSGARISPLEMPEEVWDKCVDLNLKAAFLCTKAVSKVMIDQGRGGRIINLSSVAASRGQMLSVAYSAAKAGIINFTLSMSNYLAPHKIRVNCISPGSVVSEGTRHPSGSYISDERARERAIPLTRIGQPEDIALAAIFFASDAADWVTGVTIEVRGGEYLGGLTLKAAEDQWAAIKDAQQNK
ncbi:SDR family NAD(P)-dependent oxidoreductase [Chloroflexota bacterium]